MPVPQSRSVQQLAEVLATLVSASTESAATQGAVERIAECFESEAGAVVKGETVVASVGFRQDREPPAWIAQVAAGTSSEVEVEVAGAGPCRAVVVPVPSDPARRLLLARSGDDGFSLEEVSLLRSMGRILANALDMLHLRDMVARSEARFRRIVETANEGIWLLDVDGRTTFANDKIGEILGYDPEEMASLSMFDALDEQGRGPAARNLERRRQGLSDQLECAFLRKDRTHVWALLNASPLVDGDGQYVGSLCMISDISQRKRMEDVLSQREQQLAEAQRVAGLGSFEWDLATDSLAWSDELCRMLGFEPGGFAPDFAGFLTHVFAADRGTVEQRMRAAIDGSDLYELEYRIVRSSGEVVWIHARSEVVCDETGQPYLMRGTLIDINASKLTEEALRETTARFRLLQVMATAANEASGLEEVLQVAVDEICAHTGWVAGHAYLPAGAVADSVVPLSIWHMSEPESFAPLRDAMAPARLAPALGLPGRVLATRAAAWTRGLQASSASTLERAAADLHLDGSFAFPVCVGTEVTCILEFFSTEPVKPDTVLLETIGQVATQLSRVAERQRASHELATARDAAMETSRLKSDFLATMSHEIRTPMNGVIGLTGLLLDSGLNDTQRQYANGVRASGEALLGIINDILDFSKIEAGKLELEAVEFNLAQALEEVVALVAEPARAKGLELVVYCLPGVPKVVVGDVGRIRQIVLNLVSNAVKFTHSGEVVVRASVSSPPGADPVGLHLEVADTGIGIAAASVERLFEPFSQADASTTRRYGGTGLGLAICRRLTGAMGGTIGVESQLGAGSTFFLDLPVGRASREPAAAEHAAEQPLRGLRVLVVDDNHTNRLVLASQLLAWDIAADLAADGETAIDHLRHAATEAHPYDLALVDMAMPGMNGLELAVAIRAEPALRSLRLLLLTSVDVDAAAVAAAGFSARVSKPTRLSQLYDTIVRTLAPPGPAAAPPAPWAPAETPAVKGRLLIVEDNAINQAVAKGMVAKLGYACDVAGNGIEALDALDRRQYDAVLMDCQMPDMDGFEATVEIRRRQVGTRSVPIIAMTAGALAEDREKCLAAGMDDYLSKPVTRRELDAVLSRWLPADRD